MAEETTTQTAPIPAVPVKNEQPRGGQRGGFHGHGQGRGQGGGQQRGEGGAGGQQRGGHRMRRVPRERVRSEFDQKIISIRRVTRVVAGGRRFNFSVAIVIGNGRGQVGVGLGKGADTASAIEKALANAKKNIIVIPLTEGQSIPHESRAKYASSTLFVVPAPGKGLKAGSSVRTVLELGGVKHASAKILSRSKNRLNNARAAVLALTRLRA